MSEPAEISSYQVATIVASMSKRQKNKDIAAELGKSDSWVSRILKTWNRATPALHKAWGNGLNYEAVRKISALSQVQQFEACQLEDPKLFLRNLIPGPEHIKRRFLSWDGPDGLEQPRAYVRGMLAMARYLTGEIDESGFDEAWGDHKNKVLRTKSKIIRQ